MSVEANLEAAFDMANKWREASGQEILSAWIPSRVGDANHCLLASAFNKHCGVYYNYVYVDQKTVPDTEGVGDVHTHDDREVQMEAGTGYVVFSDAADVAKFAHATGWSQISTVAVQLPDEIALVAYEFDHGAYSEHTI